MKTVLNNKKERTLRTGAHNLLVCKLFMFCASESNNSILPAARKDTLSECYDFGGLGINALPIYLVNFKIMTSL